MALYRISDLNVAIKTNSPTLAENIKRYEVTYKAEPNITLEISDDRLIELMEENEGITADLEGAGQLPDPVILGRMLHVFFFCLSYMRIRKLASL